jgi:hypothetical protein
LVAGYGGVIDTVDYTVQEDGVSEGCFPDGSTNRVRFPGRASPGLPNASPDSDSDGDGIPDRWESTHGLRPDLASDALEDPDGDGASNLAEYLSGTDPRSALSCFRLTVVHDAITGWFLRFTAEPGRTYLLQASDSLGSAWKRTQEFTGGSVPREVLFSLPLDGDHRCYRVIIP